MVTTKSQDGVSWKPNLSKIQEHFVSTYIHLSNPPRQMRSHTSHVIGGPQEQYNEHNHLSQPLSLFYINKHTFQNTSIMTKANVLIDETFLEWH